MLILIGAWKSSNEAVSMQRKLNRYAGALMENQGDKNNVINSSNVMEIWRGSEPGLDETETTQN